MNERSFKKDDFSRLAKKVKQALERSKRVKIKIESIALKLNGVSQIMQLVKMKENNGDIKEVVATEEIVESLEDL